MVRFTFSRPIPSPPPVAWAAAIGILLLVSSVLSQAPAPRVANAFVVLTRDGRHSLATTVLNGQDVVALDDLARQFQLTVREDAVAGGLTLSARAKTLVLSTTQGLASTGGRLLSLSGPPVKQGVGWQVPIDVISRALPLLLDTRIDVRRDSRLIVVGDLRIPRIATTVEATAAQTRIVMTIAPPAPHVVEQEAGRLVIRFDADGLDAPVPPIPSPDVLASMRVLESGTAIALELGPGFASYRASDQPIENAGTRLTVDLLSNAPPSTSVLPSSPPPPPAIEPPPLFETPTTALRTVVIDPGHGGDETGAKGPGGALEKDIVLGVARQLKTLLESRLGVRVLLTRDSDQAVSLDQRASFANNNKADVFLSLHANASVRASARGAEVFYLSAGEYNNEARQQTALEGESLPVVSGGDRKVEMILWEMAQLQHLEDSAALATLLERQLREHVSMSTIAIQQAPFRVLVGANMPAVLVEIGFVTNGDEEKLLASANHQAVLAQALFESLTGFRSYLDAGRRPLKTEADQEPASGKNSPLPASSRPGAQ